MTYEVLIQPIAKRDLVRIYRWVSRYAPVTAAKWLERFQQRIASLARLPERCPLARENHKVSLEIRELHFGRYPSVFRVIFTIKQNEVRVLRIRRAQRRDLSRREIEQSASDD